MYAIVDIETTGGYAAAHGIMEISIHVFDGTTVVKKFETLINPRQSIPRYIQAMTGITDEMVASAPLFEDVAEAVFDHLKENIFIAAQNCYSKKSGAYTGEVSVEMLPSPKYSELSLLRSFKTLP